MGETLWRPIAKAMALFVGLVSVSAAIGVGGSWTFGIKVLVVVALQFWMLLTLLISVLYVAYLLYKKMLIDHCSVCESEGVSMGQRQWHCLLVSFLSAAIGVGGSWTIKVLVVVALL